MTNTQSFGAAPQLVSSIGLTCSTLLGDKEYKIQSPEAATALSYVRLMSLGMSAVNGHEIRDDDPRLTRLKLDDTQERTFLEDMLGDTLDTMLADGVDLPTIQHAGMTVLVWIWQGVDTAGRYWHGESMGKALAPKAPQDRKPKARRRTTR